MTYYSELLSRQVRQSFFTEFSNAISGDTGDGIPLGDSNGDGWR
ncbi:hypothetical protein [Baaleninema sp.]